MTYSHGFICTLVFLYLCLTIICFSGDWIGNTSLGGGVQNPPTPPRWGGEKSPLPHHFSEQFTAFTFLKFQNLQKRLIFDKIDRVYPMISSIFDDFLATLRLNLYFSGFLLKSRYWHRHISLNSRSQQIFSIRSIYGSMLKKVSGSKG